MPYISTLERFAEERGKKAGHQEGRAEGLEEGRAEGRVEGHDQGIREGLLRAIGSGLKLRFGDEGLLPRIQEIQDADRLQALVEALLLAKSLEEFRALLEDRS